jgi:heat shock protein HtpX
MMLTLGVLANVLGLNHYLSASGINYESMFILCLFWGMGGAFLSLLMSKRIAKWTMRLEMVEPGSGGAKGELAQRVHNLAGMAGLRKMPEVAIYNSPEINAFATGPSKSNSLVAVSTGLLNNMSKDEVEGVLGHEVAHIANGDMVTMTLVQGVVNAFVMFFAKAIAWAAANAMRSEDDDGPSFGMYYALQFVLQLVLGVLGMIVVAKFSRMREFRADVGGAQLAGKDKMIAALSKLKSGLGMLDQPQGSGQEALAAFKISGKKSSIFSTHPDLDDRIQALKSM